VIVILTHWEGGHIVAARSLGSPIHSLTWASTWEMSMDGQVGIVLELKLLLVWVSTVVSVRLP